MLVQVRSDGLRLVRQHDHALMAGALARSWGPSGRERGPRPFRLVLATALHDLAWRELDAEPRYDAERSRPYGFDEHPLEPTLAAYRAGLNRTEELSPYAALLGSLHYASFLTEDEAPRFLSCEEERRGRLRDELERPPLRDAGRRLPAGGHAGGSRPELERRVERDLAWLKFFDGLSIRLCLTAPGGLEDELPPWLDPDRPLEPPEGGEPLRLTWEGPGTASLQPWPLAVPVRLEVPVRALDARSYADAGALRRAWQSAEEREWRLTLRPSR